MSGRTTDDSGWGDAWRKTRSVACPLFFATDKRSGTASNPQEVLVAREAELFGLFAEMRPHVVFEAPAARRVREVQEVEHEFGDGVGRGEARRAHVRLDGVDTHLVRMAALRVGRLRQAGEHQCGIDVVLTHASTPDLKSTRLH